MESLQQSIRNIFVELQASQFTGLGNWKYLLLAILTFFEGPISTLLAAAGASFGLMNPVLVFFSSAAGNLAGDTTWYLVGRLGKKIKLERLIIRVGLNPTQLDRLNRQMYDSAPTVLFFAKLFNSLIIPCLIAAGLAKVTWRRWFLPILGAEIIWTGTLVVVGYSSFEILDKVETDLPWIGLMASAIFGLILLGFVWRSVRRRKSAELLKSLDSEAEDKDLKKRITDKKPATPDSRIRSNL